MRERRRRSALSAGAMFLACLLPLAPLVAEAQLSVEGNIEQRGCCNMVLLCEGRVDAQLNKENLTFEECKAAEFSFRPRCPFEVDKRFTAGARCADLPEFTGTWGDGSTGPAETPETTEPATQPAPVESSGTVECDPADYDQAVWKAPPQAEVKKTFPNGDLLENPICMGSARVFTAEGEECNAEGKRFSLCCSAKRQVIDQLDLVYHVCPTATECLREDPMPSGCQEWFRNNR